MGRQVALQRRHPRPKFYSLKTPPEVAGENFARGWLPCFAASECDMCSSNKAIILGFLGMFDEPLAAKPV